MRSLVGLHVTFFCVSSLFVSVSSFSHSSVVHSQLILSLSPCGPSVAVRCCRPIYWHFDGLFHLFVSCYGVWCRLLVRWMLGGCFLDSFRWCCSFPQPAFVVCPRITGGNTAMLTRTKGNATCRHDTPPLETQHGPKGQSTCEERHGAPAYPKSERQGK